MESQRNPKFLEAFFQPDLDYTSENRISICNAADLLDIGEFELLERAWLNHTGKSMTRKQETYLFQNVILDDQAPKWAVNYAQSVILKENSKENSKENPKDRKINNLQNPESSKFVQGILLLFFLIIGILMLVFLITKPTEQELEVIELQEKQENPTGNYDFLNE